MKDIIQKHLHKKTLKNLLIAPCGSGGDYPFLKEFSEKIYGIDLSPIAVKNCPPDMKVIVGDILETGYSSEKFDLVASPLFFHHLVKYGFDPFLKEFYRILKPKGKLVILDFSIFYPLNAITRPLKRIFNNPYGEVEDEDPFRPKLMLLSLKRVGFSKIEVSGATFSHCSFFLPIAKIINIITKPLLKKWPFKLFSWMILFWAEKP